MMETDRELLLRIEALSADQRRLLARRIQERRERALEPRAASGEPGAPLPLTPGQLRLWRTWREAPDVPSDVVCQVVSLDGPLDADLLERCLAAVVARHEALRTTFETVDGEPRQRVRPDLRVPLERLDLAGADPELLDRRAAERSWQPFDPERGPLLRWALARLGPERHALLVTVHNLIFDAWSFRVLLDELTALHEGADPPPAVQFAGFAAWQQRWLAGGEGRAQLDFWRRELAPPLPPPLPTDHPRRGGGGRRGRRVPFTLPAAVREPLVQLGRREGATPFMVWATLVQIFVRGRTGADDVVIGTLNANRSRPATAGIVGYLLNTVPLRAGLAGDPDLATAVRRGRKAALSAQGHADLPYERMAAEIAAGRDLFDVLFIFENIPPSAGRLGGAALATRDVDKGTARHDLTIAIYDEERLHGWLEYDTALFDAATAEAMAAAFVRLAEDAAARPRAPLSKMGELGGA
jgi:hypothetical protein